MTPVPVSLIRFIRSDLVESEHFGYIVRFSQKGIIDEIGVSEGQPFCLRSCMKPLQATIAVDFDLVDFVNLSLPEVAISTASHAGEDRHVVLVDSILKKIGLTEKDLLCPAEEPLSLQARQGLLLSGKNPSKLHSNCSGKHALMLAACVKNGWNIKNYDSVEHLLQKHILSKVAEFAETEEFNIPVSTDGCGLPVCALSLKQLCISFLNIFLNPKYNIIRHAFEQYPYIIGGDGRLDSEIINASSGKLIAKVGAGGLIAVVNPEVKQAVAVKIADASMQARAIVTVEYLKKIGWLSSVQVESTPLFRLCDKRIKTLAGKELGEAVCNF